jgi:hypothetical protein
MSFLCLFIFAVLDINEQYEYLIIGIKTLAFVIFPLFLLENG